VDNPECGNGTTLPSAGTDRNSLHLFRYNEMDQPALQISETKTTHLELSVQRWLFNETKFMLSGDIQGKIASRFTSPPQYRIC
jgi:hypothetical protein